MELAHLQMQCSLQTHTYFLSELESVLFTVREHLPSFCCYHTKMADPENGNDLNRRFQYLRTHPHGWRWPPPLKSPQSPPTDGWRMARHQLSSAAMLKSDKPIWQNRSIPWLLMPWFLLVTRTSATRLLNRKYEKSFAFHKKLFHALYHISFKQDIQRTASRDQKMRTFAERGHFK